MPELLSLIACEKVILDASGVPTIVSVIEKVEVEVPNGTTVPENAVSPKEWFVYATWRLSAGEVFGAEYRHVTEIAAPSTGLPRPRITSDFKFNGELHKIVQTMFGLPIGKEGTLSANVWLERPEGSPVTSVYSYPIQVKHKLVKAANPVTAEPR
jgi:hypothetical protein